MTFRSILSSTVQTKMRSTPHSQTVGVSVFQILKETVEGVSVALEQQFFTKKFCEQTVQSALLSVFGPERLF